MFFHFLKPGVFGLSASLFIAFAGCSDSATVDLPDPSPFGGCQLDANCPAHSSWFEEGNAVIDVRGSEDPDEQGCTGVLLNNASGDGAPLVLLARHCASGRAPGETIPHWKFYFGRRSSSCNGSISPTVPPCTESNRCIQGGTIVAATLGTDFSANNDFILMRMSQSVPASFNAYYAGWAVDGVSMETATILGYPKGLPLVIVYSHAPSEITSICTPGSPPSMWRIPIDEGQIEIGQSGSPVFDQRRYVRAIIRTGTACVRPTFTCAVDLAYNWTAGDPGFRLVDHLAGGDSSLTRVDGRPG